jgi:hypothetical protein
LRLALPGRWAELGHPELGGRVRCRRRFGYPGRIDPHERVWLTFAGVADRAAITLNEIPVGQSAGPADFDVTSLLKERNELRVDVEGPVGQGGLWGEVALEVRCTAYLRGVRAWTEAAAGKAQLHAAGEVVGLADRPLDLYVILDRSPLVETQVEPVPAGRPFHLQADMPSGREPSERHVSVQVDLVNGAVVWYTIILPLALDAPGREA